MDNFFSTSYLSNIALPSSFVSNNDVYIAFLSGYNSIMHRHETGSLRFLNDYTPQFENPIARSGNGISIESAEALGRLISNIDTEFSGRPVMYVLQRFRMDINRFFSNYSLINSTSVGQIEYVTRALDRAIESMTMAIDNEEVLDIFLTKTSDNIANTENVDLAQEIVPNKLRSDLIYTIYDDKLRSNISLKTGNIEKPHNLEKFTQTPIGKISKNIAVSILSELFTKLSPEHFLVYGSVAKELLNSVGNDEFGDVDIITALPLEKAVNELKMACDSLKLVYTNNSYQEGNFLVSFKDKKYKVQIIDVGESKLAFPRGFVTFNQHKFDDYIKIDGNNDVKIPCVPLKYLDSHKGIFYFKNDPKYDIDHSNNNRGNIFVSRFEF